ncbi:DUF262 domain-containing protein [Dermabacteraceae bacterium P13101]
MNAQKMTLHEVIQKGQHAIPRYQREYAWETQNIIDFWNDIIDGDSGPHFLGSMVTTGGGKDKPIEVIDGQQRLTTTIICLSVLRDLYEEFECPGRLSGINTYIQYVATNGETRSRLKSNDTNAKNRLNDNIILPKNKRKEAPAHNPECLESKTYSIFEELIRGRIKDSNNQAEDLGRIGDKMLAAEVVYINVADRKNAFTIFETLNDRGKNLTTCDLVKNLLVSEIPAGDEDSSERSWSNILQRVADLTFEGMSPDLFLYYSWNSRFHVGKPSSDITEINRIRRSITSVVESSSDRNETASSLIASFENDANILSALDQTLMSNGQADVWKKLDKNWRKDKYDDICKPLYGILVSGSRQPFPLLLALMRSYLSEKGGISRKNLITFLGAIESFQFRWSIAQKASTSAIRKMYRQAASSISENASQKNFLASLELFVSVSRRIGASDTQFVSGIKKLSYSKNKTKDHFKIKHILTQIEAMHPYTKLDLSREVSIEHLQGTGGRSEATPRNSWIFKLGNLALLPPEINSKLPAAFRDKCPQLSEWINPRDEILTESLSTGDWDNELAKNRLDQIANLSLQIWQKPDEPEQDN